MRVRLFPALGDRMAGITPLFDNLWNEYIIWSFLVGGFTFIWLYHHSLWYKSEEGEDWDNKDGIEVGVFPKHYDNFTLEVAWTILPFFLGKQCMFLLPYYIFYHQMQIHLVILKGQ